MSTCVATSPNLLSEGAAKPLSENALHLTPPKGGRSEAERTRDLITRQAFWIWLEPRSHLSWRGISRRAEY